MPGIIETKKYVHPHGAAPRGRVLMLASSPLVSSQTGWPVGFWLAELTHPLLAFMEAGYEVRLASTEGGKIEADSFSDPTDPSGYAASDIISLGFLQRDWFRAMISQTIPLSEVQAEGYDAIFLVGGQGPMYSFRGNRALQSLFASFYEAGKPSAAVCHSTTLLLEARDSKGELLVYGKNWTGFSNEEEDYADKATGITIQPYRIEDEARKISGTHFKTAPAFSSYAIADGNLVTGQQQNSGEAAAELVIQLLESRL